jgi:hypothetical protein
MNVFVYGGRGYGLVRPWVHAGREVAVPKATIGSRSDEREALLELLNDTHERERITCVTLLGDKGAAEVARRWANDVGIEIAYAMHEDDEVMSAIGEAGRMIERLVHQGVELAIEAVGLRARDKEDVEDIRLLLEREGIEIVSVELNQ